MADEATQRILIHLQAKDRDFQRAMDRNNKMMAQVTKQMQGNLDGVAKAFTTSSKSAADSAKVFSASFSDAGESVERLRDAMNPLRKAARDLQADENRLNRALREGVISAREHGRMMDFLRGRYKAAEDAAEALTRAQAGATGRGAAAGQLQNASYQFQDIIVQISSGTAASVALGQQLPQLLSGFGAVGAGAGLAAALMIPLGAALLKMAANSGTLDEKLETLAVSTDLMTEAAEAQAIPISELRNRYGDLADEVARANDAMAMMTAIRAKSDLIGTANSLGRDFRDANIVIPEPDMSESMGGLTDYEGARRREALIVRQRDAIDDLRKKTGATAEQFDRLREAINRTDRSDSFEAVAADTENLLNVIADLYEGADKKQRQFLDRWSAQVAATMNAATRQIEAEKRARLSLIEAYDATTQKLANLSDELQRAENERAKAVAAGLKDEVTMWNRIIAKIREAVRETKDAAAEADKMMERGTFWSGPYQAPPDHRGSAFSTTRDLISRFEGGYQPEPYMDVTKYRAGYGSETYVTADGVTKAVVAGVKVSKEDADRDLDQRILRYFEEQRRVVGPAWISFTDAQKAALASVQHNYGSIPNRIRPALATGDAQTIATALAGLAMDYTRDEKRDGTPQNYNRRMQEAAAFGDTSAQAGRNADANQRLQDEIRERERKLELVKQYGENLSKNLLTEQQTAQLEAQRAQQITAINASGMADADKAAAIAAVNAEMQRQVTVMGLIAEAQRRGVDLDAQMIGSAMTYRQAIEALGEAQYNRAIADQQAAAASDQLKRSQEFAAQQTQALKEGLVDAIIEGNNFSDVLANVAKALAKAALQAALFGEGPFAGGGGGGGLLGGLFSMIGGGSVRGNDALSQALKAIPGFGGFRAGGGPVRAGSAYIVNENTPNSELFVPGMNGAILNVPQAQAALSGSGQEQGGGAVEVRVFMDENGNWQAAVERISGRVTAQAAAAGNKTFSQRVQRSIARPRERT